jgi:hypothetical protein
MNLWLTNKLNTFNEWYTLENFEDLSILMKLVDLYQHHSPLKVSCKNTIYNPTFDTYL